MRYFLLYLRRKDSSIDNSAAIVEYQIMAGSITEQGHAPKQEVRSPVATHGATLVEGKPVSFGGTGDYGEHPIFVLPGEEPISEGMLKLAKIVGPPHWNALVAQTKSDMTPERRSAFLTTLLTTPVLDGVRIAKWNRGDWRVSRHDTDNAYTFADTPLRGGHMRHAQAGFAQHLNRFIQGFPEGERDMRELFQAIYELGTSGDWEKNPNLARGVANAFWDVGKVLESWTAQPQNDQSQALPAAV